MTLDSHWVLSFTFTDMEKFKGKSSFFINKSLVSVDYIAYKGRNVRKIRDVRVHFCLV